MCVIVLIVSRNIGLGIMTEKKSLSEILKLLYRVYIVIKHCLLLWGVGGGDLLNSEVKGHPSCIDRHALKIPEKKRKLQKKTITELKTLQLEFLKMFSSRVTAASGI